MGQADRQGEPQRKLAVQYKEQASSLMAWHSLGCQDRGCFVPLLIRLRQMVRPVPSHLILIILVQNSSQHTGVYLQRGFAGSCAGGSEAIRNSQPGALPQ